MNRRNFLVKSNCDGLDIYCTMFVPDNDIKGIFQICHGMAEHKERYFDFMEFLCNNGYVCVINDHRGHGSSVKDINDLGYFYDDTSNYIVEDLRQVTMYVKDMFPNKNIILFGHSMGSLVVRKYIKMYDSDIYKLIVCGSVSKNSMASIGLNVSKFMKLFMGDRYRSKLINYFAVGNYNKGYDIDNAWICSNSSVVDLYNKDNLCGFVFTLNGFINLFRLLIDTYSNKNWNVCNKDLSILFIAGSNDCVIGNYKKWISSQRFLKRVGYSNISCKLYDGMRHEILNDYLKDDVYKDILSFIDVY